MKSMIIAIIYAYATKGGVALSSRIMRSKSARNCGISLCQTPNKNVFNDDAASSAQHLTRRSFASLLPFSLLLKGNDATAASPLSAEEADNFKARAERALRPKPPKVLRTRMNLDFAVLLMRSSYNAVDSIDIVPMQQFQKDFFLIRQAEYQYYANSLGPGAMQQGDLADPNYFDFISFAQYATINRELNDPAVIFEEQQPVDVGEGQPQQFDTVVVKRDSLVSKSQLAQRHTDIVGNAILNKLIEKFGDTPSAIPKIEVNSRPDAATLLASVKQMVNLFVVNGFAFNATASISKTGTGLGDAAGTEFSVIATSPANLWSGQSLKTKNAILANDFLLKTAKTLISRVGYSVTKSSVSYSNNQEITIFTIT